MEQKQKGFEVNRFYYYANDLIDRAVEESEIATIDMTNEFWEEIEEEIKSGEIIIMQLIAKMRLGKSTTGIAIALIIFNLLKKHKKIPEDTKFSMKNIGRDQQEFSKMMRNPKLCNTVVVTDEFNELENTGENVTVEQALNSVFSSVQAVRYVHRVSCSPKEIIDPNTDIILEVIGIDRKKHINMCHLYYRFFKGGFEHRQPLGYINIYVGDLIRNWLKIKDMFAKPERTKEETEEIEAMAKKDFYVEYMIKKNEKIELITREGILRPRMIDYAPIVLQIEERLRNLAKLKILNRTTIRNYVRMYCRKEKIPTSIIGEELMTQEVEGILNLWESQNKIARDILILGKKERTKDVEHRLEMLTDMNEEIKKTISAQIEELKRYTKIKEKYDAINE